MTASTLEIIIITSPTSVTSEADAIVLLFNNICAVLFQITTT